jgi:hypothetical protein
MKYLLTIILSLFFGIFSVEASDLNSLEALVDQWVGLRKEIAQEKQTWNRQQQQWRQEIDLLEKESKLLDEEIAKARKFEATNAGEIAEQLKRRETLRKTVNEVGIIVDKTAAELSETVPMIPKPLRTERMIHLESENGRNTLPVTQRLQLLAAAMSEIEKTENEIHAVRELLVIDGQRREMDVVYLGLACGFAVSPDNSTAAYGYPAKDSRQWTTAPGLASEVRKLIDIKNHEQPPQIVRLPIKGGAREVKQ